MPLSLELSRRDVIVGLGKMAGAAVAASRLPTPNISSLLPPVQSRRQSTVNSEINPKINSAISGEICWHKKGPFLVGDENQVYTFKTYSCDEDRYLEVDLKVGFDAESYLTLLKNLARLTNKTADLDNYLSNHQLRIWLDAPRLGGRDNGSSYYLAVGRWSGDPVLAYSLDEVRSGTQIAKEEIPNLISWVGPEMLTGFPFHPETVSKNDVHEAWHLLEDAALVRKIPRWTHKPIGAALGVTAQRFSRREVLTAGLYAGGLYAGATLGAFFSTPLRLVDHLKMQDIVITRFINHPDIKDLPSPFRPVVLKVS